MAFIQSYEDMYARAERLEHGQIERDNSYEQYHADDEESLDSDDGSLYDEPYTNEDDIHPRYDGSFEFTATSATFTTQIRTLILAVLGYLIIGVVIMFFVVQGMEAITVLATLRDGAFARITWIVFLLVVGTGAAWLIVKFSLAELEWDDEED